MLVSDVMTRGAETIGPEESIQAAARRMRETGVGMLVVCEGVHPVGILTDRDIVVRSTAEGLDPAVAGVRSAMTAQVVSCSEDADLAEAARIMEQRAVRRVIVLDAEEALVGMLSVDDVALVRPELAGEIVEHVRAPGRPFQRGPWPWWQ
jgi:CBS domain-containing protein